MLLQRQALLSLITAALVIGSQMTTSQAHAEDLLVKVSQPVSTSRMAMHLQSQGLKTEVLRFMIVEVDHPELIGKGIKKKEMEAEI